ncbi:MAG: transposase [Candidatus Korobacteraceae bacterium]
MRSGTNCTISSGQVYSWAVGLLLNVKLVKDHGWKCTAAAVLGITLRAASRCISVSAACRDLAKAPSDQAVMTALEEGLPKTLLVLERRLNNALSEPLPRRMRRRAWNVAIDWHLQPYYGQPFRSRNELYYGQPKQGTAKFHAYASACIVEYGRRYTLALTWVRRHESMVRVLRRLVARIREIGLKIRRLLLDRAFFNGAVVEFLQEEQVPFVMPVVIRGRAPKKGTKPTGLRWIKRQAAGWYTHMMKHGKQLLKISVCVGYRRHRHRKDGKQRHQKLLFAAWRVNGSPTEIRELYRLRFGIESSFRQMRQARIYTCTRNPRLRLFFLAVALILRNLWVWIHHMHLAEGRGDAMTLHLELLRFKRMLDWIVCEILALFHDGSIPYVIQPP